MRYTLRNITDCLYKKKVHNQIKISEEELATYYNSQSRNFNEIIHALDLDEEINYLKTNRNPNGNFSFYEDDKIFLVDLLSEYSGKLDPLRRGNFYDIDDEYVIWVYENMIDVFRRCNSTEDEIKKIAFKMNNRLDYPLRKRKESIFSFERRMAELMNKVFSVESLPLNNMDLYIWLKAFEQDYKLVINQWFGILNRMSEIRECELNDLAEKEMHKMDSDEIEEANIDWMICERLNHELESDEEYNKLKKEYNKMCGISDDISQVVEEKGILYHKDKNQKVSIKKPHVKKVEKKFKEIQAIMNKRYDEIRLAIIRDIFPDYIKKENKKCKAKVTGLCSSEQVLKNAIKELKEDINDQKRVEEERINTEFPEIDFEEIRKDIKNICLLCQDE